jgi:Lrp/AsnC family leucine-responsive transcriptional regulator
MAVTRTHRELDQIDWALLCELQADARLSYAELGRRVHLSTPAVAERVRRLEERRAIRGYYAAVDPAALGLRLQAIIRIRATQYRCDWVRERLQTIPEVLECLHVTGADDFIINAAVTSVGHLERLLDELRPLGDHITSIILSSPVARRPIGAALIARGAPVAGGVEPAD